MGRWIGAIPPGGTSTSYGSATGFGEFDNDGRGVYKGDWKDGKRHGQGECRWPNGNVYKGGWKDDKQHGQGEYRYANGDVYKGGFQNGGRHGQGTMTRADGTVEIGRWEKGKLVEPNTARAAEQKAAAAAKEKAAAREKAARDKKAASEARIAAEQEAAALAEQLAEMKATAEAEQKAASLAKQVADMKNKLVEPNTPPALISRKAPTQEGKAWVFYKGPAKGFYFTATGAKSWSHDEVYQQNPLLTKSVGTKADPRAGITECTQGIGAKGAQQGGRTEQRQAAYSRLQKDVLMQMEEELRAQEAMVSNGQMKEAETTIHAPEYRPKKGAWVLYNEYCFTATGGKNWSHDEVYDQHPLLALVAGTRADPRKAIMDITQGSGANDGGEGTGERQATYKVNEAMIEKQMIGDVRIRKLAAAAEKKPEKKAAADKGGGGAEKP